MGWWSKAMADRCSPDDYGTKAAAIVALASMFLQLLGGLYFWQERVLFADAAHILFRIINEGSLQIQEHRIGSFITQGQALLAVKAGLPLEPLMILYSASFPLFYLVVGLLLYRFCRRYDLVIMLAAYHLLLCSSTWYWTNNEVHQGVTWLLLVFGFLYKMKEQRASEWGMLVVLVAGLLLALFTHPLVMIPAIALWGFWLIDGRLPFQKRWSVIVSSLLLVLLVYLKYRSSSEGWYDGSRMEGLRNVNFKMLGDAFDGAVVHTFLHALTHRFLLFAGLLGLGLANLIFQRKWILLLWVVGNILGFILLLSLTYPTFDQFYIESEWMSIAIIGIAPLIYYGLPRCNFKLAFVAGTLMVMASGVMIFLKHQSFTDRIVAMNTTLDNMRKRGIYKAALPAEDEVFKKELILYWGAPVESMMLSALAGEHPQRSFVYEVPEKMQEVLSLRKDEMRAAFSIRPAAKLNPKYFVMDTTTAYQLLQF